MFVLTHVCDDTSHQPQESEGEDAEASRVLLPAAAPGRAGKALAGRQSRVRLHEVGPRLELEIVKVGHLCTQLPCCRVVSELGLWVSTW